MLASISTHTPLAGSDELYAHRIPGLIFISTHTPLAGSDGTFYNYNLTIYPFQPTLPSRGVTATFNKFLFHILCRIDNYLSNDLYSLSLSCIFQLVSNSFVHFFQCESHGNFMSTYCSHWKFTVQTPLCGVWAAHPEAISPVGLTVYTLSQNQGTVSSHSPVNAQMLHFRLIFVSQIIEAQAVGFLVNHLRQTGF